MLMNATWVPTWDENASCTNTPGGFNCACNTGYNGDGVSCVDNDECDLNTNNWTSMPLVAILGAVCLRL